MFVAIPTAIPFEPLTKRFGYLEGRTTGWICLDYGSVIVHIFTRDQREFYGLDRMWSDGEPVDMNEILVNSKEED